MLVRCLWVCVAFGGLSVRAGAWDAAPQPQLEKALADAPLLEPEHLGVMVKGVQSRNRRWLVPNPDGTTYDVLQWYYEEYDGPTWLYAIDLGTGRVKRQRFPDLRSIHMGTLVCIDPKDGRVEPVGRLNDIGNFIFVGKDMYLTGTAQLRRIRWRINRKATKGSGVFVE